MMMLLFVFLLRRLAAEKVVFLLFFLTVFGSFWIVAFHLHLFLGRKVREMANEADQPPTVFLRALRSAKRRHTRKANAIFNDPKYFTIGQLLGIAVAKIGRLGIQPAAHHGVAAPVISVANSAMISKVQPGIAEALRRFGNRILLIARVFRNCHVAGAPRHDDFQPCRLCARTKTIVKHSSGREQQHGDDHHDGKQDCVGAAH